jgi:hypothetical protein
VNVECDGKLRRRKTTLVAGTRTFVPQSWQDSVPAMRTALHRMIGGLVAATALAVPAGASADQLFAPDSFWNAPLPANVDLDATGLAGRLQAQVGLDESLHRGPWINIGAYSTPLYVVGPNVPGQRVQVGGTNLLGPSTHNVDPNLRRRSPRCRSRRARGRPPAPTAR